MKQFQGKLKNVITIENLLCAFLVLCPILDVASFLFRNHFNTSISISTVLRPVIPIVAIIYIFFKDKIKSKLLVAGFVYALYAIIHLYIFNHIVSGSSYGNMIRELQYIVNYTFMIMNLFVFLYIFIFRKNNEDRKEGIKKIRKSLLISFTIYILLMYVAILSGTSSSTYIEGIGYKGWFESGNSVGAIMTLMLFVVLPMTSKEYDKKIRIWSVLNVVLAGIYLTTLLGTRIGLFGFVGVLFVYLVCEILKALFNNKKINKKIVGVGIGVFAILAIVVIVFGSSTLARRRLLKENENIIFDEEIGERAHVTGDLMKIAHQIKNDEIKIEYMDEATQNAILDLYEFNNNHKISLTNMRMIQLVYHTALIKEQADICLLLFGNGYMSHYYELVFEMEVPAFLYNFGIFGFILYFVPFLIIAAVGILYGIKYINKLTVKGAMTILSVIFGISASFLSGYIFFNQSAASVIISMCVITIYEIINMKGENIEKENNIWNNRANIRGGRTSSSGYSKRTPEKV